YNIGLILYEKGDLPSSEQQFVQAVTKDPQLEQAQYWLNEIRRNQEVQVASSNTAAAIDRNPNAGVRSPNPQRTPNSQVAIQPRTAAYSGGGSGPQITAAAPAHREPAGWPAAGNSRGIVSAGGVNGSQQRPTVQSADRQI